MAAAAMVLGVTGAAGAASLAPTSYTFDATTDCGTYCYHDAGVFTPAFTPAPASPAGELTDGVVGYAGWAVGGATPWVGWTDSQVNIDFTFAGAYTFDSVSVGTTQDSIGDVVLPDLRVYSSTDLTSWTLRGALLTAPSSANDNSSVSTAPHGFLTLSNLAFSAPYVRLTVNNHPGYGGFSFLDEVQFTGSSAPEPQTWALLFIGVAMAGVGLRRRGTRSVSA